MLNLRVIAPTKVLGGVVGEGLGWLGGGVVIHTVTGNQLRGLNAKSSAKLEEHFVRGCGLTVTPLGDGGVGASNPAGEGSAIDELLGHDLVQLHG